jgi:hypothetical protein
MSIVKPVKPILQMGHPLARGLLGAWTFHEGSGGTGIKIQNMANRAASTGTFGVHAAIGGLTAPTWVAGPFGPALSFNGTSSVIGNFTRNDIPLALHGGSEITMAVWFKGSHGQSALRIQTSDGTGYALPIWEGGSSPKSIFSWDDTTNGLIWNGSVNDGNLHFLVTTRKTSGSWINYFDSKVDGTRSSNSTTNTFTSAAYDWVMGMFSGSAGEFTNGIVDAPMVWNRVLTATEVSMLYRDPFQMFRKKRSVLRHLAPGPTRRKTYNMGY